MQPAIQTAPAAPKNSAPSPVTVAPSPTQVFENKIAGQLPLSNPIDSRQPNLSTTVSKYDLTQWNHIRKRRGARPLFFEKITHFELHPELASPGNQLQAPSAQLPALPTLNSHNSQLPAIYQKTKSLNNFNFRIKWIAVNRTCRQPSQNRP